MTIIALHQNSLVLGVTAPNSSKDKKLFYCNHQKPPPVCEQKGAFIKTIVLSELFHLASFLLHNHNILIN